MQQADFELLVERIRKETTELLITKGREYAGDADRLANFKRGAALTGIDPLAVLFVYMSKHYDALATYVKDVQKGGELPATSEPITGRLADLINYCVLAWALVEEAKQKPEIRVEVPPMTDKIRLKTKSGRIAIIVMAQACDKFLLELNRKLPGTSMVYEGEELEYWAYASDNVWRPV